MKYHVAQCNQLNNSVRMLSVSLVVYLLTAHGSLGAPVTQLVKLDHFGYRPTDTKLAIVTTNPGSIVEIRTSTDQVVFTIPSNGGSIVSKGYDGAPSGDNVWWVDFSSFTTPGTYRLNIPSLGLQSYDFEIRDDIYNDVVITALKTFYYQRCNTPKETTYAGVWDDPQSCHIQDLTTGPTPGHTNYGTRDLTGGWHDAGDYNKYVWKAVSSAILFMLRAYEDNPGVFRDGDLNIPESGNGIPDILDEIKWELDWLLKMQLTSGEVLYQMHVDGFASDSPPSMDTNIRYYQNPNLESGSVFAGTTALASRVFKSEGILAYADTLKTAAVKTWNWLMTQGHSEEKVWAAAEVFRTDPTVTSARNYVDNFYPSNWSGRFFNPARYDTHAATTYVQTTGATSAVVSNMLQNISDQVNYIFSTNDLYRNGMPDWAYHWGSNLPRAATGVFLITAVKLGQTGSHTAQECLTHAQHFFHFFHGLNTLNMVYLTNIASLGGEHSSFQFYHAWFGDSTNTFSKNNYIGIPSFVNEPDYPYFKGTDNHGINDNKASVLGPPPGFVPGGPNKDYSGTPSPPLGANYYNRFYRDWNDQTVWTAKTWEITENSIGYQGTYVGLGAYFMSVQPSNCTENADCEDGLYCNGAETCVNNNCMLGNDPCPGQSCDEQTDTCFTPVCNNNGSCDSGENCSNCPNDCIFGNGAMCGNGLCEAGNGEDCISCPQDCRGKQDGSPSKRYCCGDGDGIKPVSCNDGRCISQGYQCTNIPAEPYCCGDMECSGFEDSNSCTLDCGPAPFCGDGTCHSNESVCSCPNDCGTPPASEQICTDGLDNDCDSSIDCADPNCVGDPSCAPPACDNDVICDLGENCNSCSADCPGKNGGRPSSRYCCGDGVAQTAEGNGSICDGNF